MTGKADVEAQVKYNDPTNPSLYTLYMPSEGTGERVYVKMDESILSPDVWKAHKTYNSSGENAVLAMNNAGLIASIYTKPGTETLVFTLGKQLPNGVMSWLSTAEFAEGRNPSVSIDDLGVIFVSYEAKTNEAYVPTYRVGLYALLATDKEKKVSLRWGDPKAYAFPNDDEFIGAALSPLMSSYVLVLHRSKADNKVYYDSGTILTSSRSVSWMKNKESGTAFSGKPLDFKMNSEGDAILAYQSEGVKIYRASSGYSLSLLVALPFLNATNDVVLGRGYNPSVAVNKNKLILCTQDSLLPILRYQTAEFNVTSDKANYEEITKGAYGRGVSPAVCINDLGDAVEIHGYDRTAELRYYSTSLFSYTNAWMKNIADQTSLNMLTIPGTHNTIALYGGSLYACQTLTLRQQLDMGLRFLDIRLRLEDNGELNGYHGGSPQSITFEEIISECVAFMQKNPEETVVMSVKAEAWKDEFPAAVDSRISNTLQNWYLGATVPAVKDARKKIVLFKRYPSGQNRGIDMSEGWEDIATFTIGKVKVQDEYQLKAAEVASKKWPSITALFSESQTAPADMLYVNFASATGGASPTPYVVAWGNGGTVAKGINPYLIDYLKTNTAKMRLGCVLMDFPNEELIDALIATN